MTADATTGRIAPGVLMAAFVTVLVAFFLLLGLHLSYPEFEGRAPHCEEDEVMVRDEVPGPWRCVPLDDLR